MNHKIGQKRFLTVATRDGGIDDTKQVMKTSESKKVVHTKFVFLRIKYLGVLTLKLYRKNIVKSANFLIVFP